MNNKPKLYKSEITKNIKNNKEYCYLQNKEKEVALPVEEIKKKLEEKNNQKVRIITKDKVYNTTIIATRKDRIYTIEDEEIMFSDILSIEIIV